MSIVGEDVVGVDEIVRGDVRGFNADLASNRFETLTKLSEIMFDRSELLERRRMPR